MMPKIEPILLEVDELDMLCNEDVSSALHTNVLFLSTHTFENKSMRGFIDDHVMPYILIMLKGIDASQKVKDFVGKRRFYSTYSYVSILEALGDTMRFNDAKTVASYILTALIKLCRKHAEAESARISISGGPNFSGSTLTWKVQLETDTLSDEVLVEFSRYPADEW